MAVDLVTPDPTALYRVRDGVYAPDLLIAAVAEFDLFSWLTQRGPVTAEQACSELGMAARPACRELVTVLRTGVPAAWASAAALDDLPAQRVLGVGAARGSTPALCSTGDPARGRRCSNAPRSTPQREPCWPTGATAKPQSGGAQ